MQIVVIIHRANNRLQNGLNLNRKFSRLTSYTQVTHAAVNQTAVCTKKTRRNLTYRLTSVFAELTKPIILIARCPQYQTKRRQYCSGSIINLQIT